MGTVTARPIPSAPPQLAPNIATQPNWFKDATVITVLYLIDQCGKKYGLDWEDDDLFIKPIVEKMSSDLHLLIFEGDRYVPSEKGKQLLAWAQQMLNILLQLEIFRYVSADRDLTNLEWKSDSERTVMAENLYDPRYNPETVVDSKAPEDFRIAMLKFLPVYLKDKLNGVVVDPHVLVFLRNYMATGKLKDFDLYYQLRLGEKSEVCQQIQAIVKDAYQWPDLCPEDEEQAKQAMLAIYRSGMIEYRKRTGGICSECQTPLASYDAYAKSQGKTLDVCPNPTCGRVFGTPPAAPDPTQPDQYACGNCNAVMYTGDRSCQSCGAIVDYSLREGQVVTDMVATVTIFEDPYAYGYVSTGWLMVDLVIEVVDIAVWSAFSPPFFGWY